MTLDPTHIGRYHIESVLGRGAMGVVYRAHDPEIDRQVAIKLIRADLLDGDDRANYVARFRREAQAAARCTHPNVVTIYDFATHEENPFLAMEFVDGISLKHVREPGKPMPPADAAFVVLQVLDALAAAHAMGVVHRDIKPANILLVAGTRVKVTDFGISRLANSEMTQDGEAIGTPSYMSPEQCRGAHVDARSDLFSTAAVLFELLCGARPFPGRTLAEVMQRVLHEPPTDPTAIGIDLAAELRAFLDRALAKSPADRFASAAEMAAALRAALAAQSEPETTPILQEDRTIVLPRRSETPPATTAAPGTASASFASHGFERDILANLERKLTHYVGPIARILVQKAVRDADTLDSLCATLSASIERPTDRAAFQREILGQFTPSATHTTTRAATIPPSAAAPPALIGDSDRAAAQRELARFIGPLAAHLVKRESAAAASPADLWRRLSLHIEKESDRAAFLARRTI